MTDPEFRNQTPQTFKWAMGAGGLVAAATTAALTFKPEAAGYSLSALILFILLIFIVISLEVGTTSLPVSEPPAKSNPLAENARTQVLVLSWFATVALILGAISIMLSILFRWPLDMTFNEDKTTTTYLQSIKHYDLHHSVIERSGPAKWQEKLVIDNSIEHKFSEDRFDAQFLLLSDDQRHLKIRIPTQGGMLEWSLNERFGDCDRQYCWGDVGHAVMRR